MILMQPDNGDSSNTDRKTMEISRLKKADLKDSDIPDVERAPYAGPKK